MIGYQRFALVFGSEMSDDDRRKCPKRTAYCPMGAVPKAKESPISTYSCPFSLEGFRRPPSTFVTEE